MAPSAADPIQLPPASPSAGDLMAYTEAAELLGMTVEAINGLVKSGTLLAVEAPEASLPKRGRRYRMVFRRDVLAYRRTRAGRLDDQLARVRGPQLGDPAGTFHAHLPMTASYGRDGHLILGFRCDGAEIVVFFVYGRAIGLRCRYDGALPSPPEQQALARQFLRSGEQGTPLVPAARGWLLLGAGGEDAARYLNEVGTDTWT